MNYPTEAEARLALESVRSGRQEVRFWSYSAARA
jgi:hypothetical protein